MTTTANLASFRATILHVYVASTMVLTRLWVGLVAIPAGILLSVLLMTNDFSATKVIEIVMVTSHETLQSLEPGTLAGTYRWTECIDAKTSEQRLPQSPAAPNQCKERVSREGPLSEALAPGVAYIGSVYCILALFSFLAMLMTYPDSSFALRSKLARVLRLNRS